MDKKPCSKTLIVVVGPTASGKTATAIALAQYYRTEILSADSRQFYKELKIGTASPTNEELSAVTHHFIGNNSITDTYNASDFEKDALRKLTNLFENHDTVIMTGGSGLYIDAVCTGIDDLPDPPSNLRKDLKMILETEGIERLQNMLLEYDPEYYQLVDLKNSARLLRALEVCIAAGKPYSLLRTKKFEPRPFNIIFVGLYCDRAILNERIHRRVDAMLENGLLNEIEELFPFRNLNALNSVGYKELFLWKEGLVSIDQAIENIKTNTRRYAKRQMTWFRKNPCITWFPYNDVSGIMAFCSKTTAEFNKDFIAGKF